MLQSMFLWIINLIFHIYSNSCAVLDLRPTACLSRFPRSAPRQAATGYTQSDDDASLCVNVALSLAVAGAVYGIAELAYYCTSNPYNAEATFDQSTRTQQIFENHLNPVILVSIGKLSFSTLR